MTQMTYTRYQNTPTGEHNRDVKHYFTYMQSCLQFINKEIINLTVDLRFVILKFFGLCLSIDRLVLPDTSPYFEHGSAPCGKRENMKRDDGTVSPDRHTHPFCWFVSSS